MSSERPCQILIVDDHELVRKGLIAILGQCGMNVVGEAANSREAMRILEKNAVDMVILDISMPGQSGIELLKDILRLYNVKVLMLSMHPERQFAARCMKLGASGYVNKHSASTELVRAINKIASGEKYLSPELYEDLALNIIVPIDAAVHEKLSDREMTVMLKLASGMGLSEIGFEMCLSVKTVSTYRSRILQKMGFKNNAELTIYCMEHKLIGDM